MKRLLRQLRILMLEDIPTDAELIERELKRSKIWFSAQRVVTREDFEEALQTSEPDVILADYNLPDFDGITALRIAHRILPDVPFVFVSGSIGEERAVEALRHGAVDYIIKDRMQRLGPAVLRALDDVVARSERRTADSALRQSEERFRSVASAITDGIWDWDLKTDSVWLSEGFRRLFGYENAPEFVDVEWVRDRVHPADRPAFRDLRQKKLKDREVSWEDRYRFQRGDGRYALVLDRARVLLGEDQRPLRVIVALSNITERIREERLQQTQFEITRLLADAESIDAAMPELLRTWSHGLDGAMAGAWFVDRAANLLRFRAAWSSEGLNLIEFETVSRSLVLGPGESIPGRVWQSGTPQLIADLQSETNFKRRDAALRAGFRSIFVFPITAGREILGAIECFSTEMMDADERLLAISRDIGSRIGQFLERKRAETALRRGLEREELIAEVSTAFIEITPEQADGQINRALERIANFSQVDRAFVVLLDRDRTVGRRTHEWQASSVPQDPNRSAVLPTGEMPWWREKLFNQETIVCARIEDLPEAAQAEKDSLRRNGVLSFMAEPLAQGKSVMGFVALDSMRSERRWSEDDITLIRIMAQIFSNALARKTADEELRKNESMLASAQRQAQLGSWELDQSTEHFTWSEELYRIFGLDPGSFAPTIETVMKRVHPDDRERVRAHFLRSGTGSNDYRIMRPNGSIRILHGTKTSVLDEPRSTVRLVGSALDITELRQAAETIQRLSRQNQLILESAAEGIFGIDPNGIATFVNPTAARMLGWTVEELVGKSIHDTAHSLRGDGSAYPWHECPSYSALTRGVTLTREEIFWRKDGSDIQIEFTATPITDPEGHRLGAVITFRNIGERKLLEKQLEQATRLSSLGRLAATIAHEFNNVLMGIQPFNELIRKQTAADPKIQKATEQIGRSIQRGKGVSQEILRYTRPAQPNMQEIDLEDWFNDFGAEMRGVLGERINLVLNTPPDRIRLLGDPLQLLQVFSNLVLNSRDVMPGGGTISIVAEPPTIRGVYPFGVVPTPEKFVHFAVNDTGPGMSSETMTKIFEPLFTTKKTGTGLGLAVTHQIVQQHRGYIFVESELGKGSTFHLFLPVAGLPAAAAPGNPAVEKNKLKIEN